LLVKGTVQLSKDYNAIVKKYIKLLSDP
jgi:hypothetical protein